MDANNLALGRLDPRSEIGDVHATCSDIFWRRRWSQEVFLVTPAPAHFPEKILRPKTSGFKLFSFGTPTTYQRLTTQSARILRPRRTEKCTTRLVLSIAQCRTHEANLDLKIAEMPACDVRSARKALGCGFARKTFPTLHGPPQYPDRARVH